MRFVLLPCALCAIAACGGSDNPPAKDPSTTATSNSLAATTPQGGTAESTPALQGSGYRSQPSASPGTAGATKGPEPSSVDPVVVDSAGAHDQTKDADNTKINDRDRHNTLTPMNQGNGGDEIKITAAIRRGLMGDKSLSFNAKNVKVITIGTKVTLRGPVNSDQEKASIEALSKQTPGVTDVDDQLEVKK